MGISTVGMVTMDAIRWCTRIGRWTALRQRVACGPPASVSNLMASFEPMDLEFRPVHRADFPLLGRWLAAPHVEPWWRESFDPVSVEARYGPCVDGAEPTELFLVVQGGREIGFVQRYLIDDHPDWKRSLEPAAVPHPSIGVDYLIGDAELLGQGLGPAIVDRFVRETWQRYPQALSVVVDVAQANRRSWRALEKCGFDRVWAGTLVSDDPSDEGPAYIYVRQRE